MNVSFLDEQLWKLLEDDERQSKTKLANKGGNWEPTLVSLPDQGEEGYIEMDDKVLAAENVTGNVIKEAKQPNENRQKWLRGFNNIEGFFTLQKSNSALYLTVNDKGKLQIQGNLFLLFHSIYMNVK